MFQEYIRKKLKEVEKRFIEEKGNSIGIGDLMELKLKKVEEELRIRNCSVFE